MPEMKTLSSVVYEGDIEKARRMIRDGANVNAKDGNGATPLMRARSREMAQMLIDAGADIHARDNYDSTVLMHVTSSGDVVRLLLENGARPDDRNEVGDTALIWCGRFARTHAAVALAEYGADATIKNHENQTFRSEAEKGHYQATITAWEETAARYTATAFATQQERLKKAAPRFRLGGPK